MIFSRLPVQLAALSLTLAFSIEQIPLVPGLGFLGNEYADDLYNEYANDFDASEPPEVPRLNGCDIAFAALSAGEWPENLSREDFVWQAWDELYEQDPFSFLQVIEDYNIARAAKAKESGTSPNTYPPPLRVSKKEGFTVYKHKSFPNYELRIKEPGPELNLDKVQQYTGYIDLLDEDKHFFFWLWESRSNPKEDPVVLWLNGGPGCSSATGEFFELGPAFVTQNLTTVYNPNAWNNEATVIFLDQPVNVGYSYSSKHVTESTVAGEDVYAFLEVLFDALPQYAGLPFHISGESYAGKYLPAVGRAILNHPERSFNLTSALIGNPITDPALQAFSSVAMACGDGGYPAVLEQEVCNSLYEKVPKCESLINSCYDSKQNPFVCAIASAYCSQLDAPYLSTGRNPYNIDDICGDNCYPEIDSIQEYMRLPKIIEAVGSDVDNFEGCSNSVGRDFLFSQDGTRNEGPDVLAMLDAGIDVLFYDGAYDWICSWPGVHRMLERLQFKNHSEFTSKHEETWYIDGKAAGETKSAGHLTWMKIYEAGHMVPHDKGVEALHMFNQWTRDRKFH